MPTPPAIAKNLDARDPNVGDRLDFRNAVWKVTERSTYTNEDGYHCIEWTCEAGSQEAYLLKETEKNNAHQWFFTLTLDEGDVALPEGDPISRWISKNGKAQNPTDLTYKGKTYHFEEKRDGLYDNDDGVRTKKTTWDYWDPPRKNNLAVEIWESGDVNCYLGYYIQASEALLTKRINIIADHPGFSSDTLKGIGYAALFAFYFLCEIGGVFDQILTFLIGIGILIGWMFPVLDAPRVAWVSIVTASALGVVFWHFPPLTTAIGALVLLGTPAALAWFMRSTVHSLSDKSARMHIAYALEIPLVFLGFVHYFKYAPAPHDFGQYCLALTPALVGALVTWGMTSLVFSEMGPSDQRTPSVQDLIR